MDTATALVTVRDTALGQHLDVADPVIASAAAGPDPGRQSRNWASVRHNTAIRSILAAPASHCGWFTRQATREDR